MTPRGCWGLWAGLGLCNRAGSVCSSPLLVKQAPSCPWGPAAPGALSPRLAPSRLVLPCNDLQVLPRQGHMPLT